MKLLKSRRERVLFALTMTVVLGLLGYFVVYQILKTSWDEMAANTDNLDAKIKAMITRIEQDKTLEANYLAMKEKLEIPGSVEEQQSEILKEITGLFEESDITPNNKPLTQEEFKNFRVFHFQFSNIDCPLESLFVFLKSIDNPTSVLEVEELKINSVYEKDTTWWVKAEIKTSRLAYNMEPATPEKEKKSKS